jgi:ketosteroid isomerase-like protein
MNNKMLIGCLLGTMIFINGAAAQTGKDSDAQSDIQALEKSWLTSQQTNNTELLAPLLADNIADTSTEGKLVSGKSATIADAKAVKWSSAEYTDLQVTMYDHTAIATGIFTGKGKDKAGKPVDVHERFTDTWVKMSDGHWRCVATHGSVIKN